MRIPLFVIVLVVSTVLNGWKYLLVVSSVIRMMEKFSHYVCGYMAMNGTSFNNTTLTYHREHKDYDFVKLQK